MPDEILDETIESAEELQNNDDTIESASEGVLGIEPQEDAPLSQQEQLKHDVTNIIITARRLGIDLGHLIYTIQEEIKDS